MNRLRPSPVLLAVFLLAGAVSLSAGVNRWTPIGPEGGATWSLDAGPGVIYTGTRSGGVLKSLDGGASWSPTSGLPPEVIVDVAVDPTNPAVAYAVPSIDNPYRTTDGGSSWFRTRLATRVDLLEVAPSEPGTLYGSSPGAFFRSTDHGTSWTRLANAPFVLLDLKVDPQDARTVYGSGGPKVFRSRDGGETWESFEPGFKTSEGAVDSVNRLAIDPRQPSTLYAASMFGALAKSTDRGATWTLIRTPSVLVISWALEVDSTGAVYAGFQPLILPIDGPHEGGIWKSADGGTAWTRILDDPRIFSLKLDPGAPGRVIVGAGDRRFYRSEDGGAHWTRYDPDLRATAVVQVIPDPHAPDRIYAVTRPLGTFEGAESVLMRSDDGGAGWTAVLGNPEVNAGVLIDNVAAHPEEPGTLYVAGQGVRRTRDGGATWEGLNRGLRPGESVASLVLAPSNPGVLYSIGLDNVPSCTRFQCARVVIFRSSNGGEQWRRSRPPLARGELLSTLAVDPANPAIVYTAGIRFFKSTDGGVTWKQTGRGLRGPVSHLLADPSAPGTLYAVLQFTRRGIAVTGIDKSTDGGATWAPADTGLPGWFGIRRLTADPETPGTLYAATDQGVFLSTNRGATWTVKLNAGLPPGTRALTVAVDPQDPRTIYTGTSGGSGLFVMTRVP
ncbi:MAG TPA: hypothetical protein VJ725_29350 [Thermoanaerobaculia bacterium]|nr:hypothetical protein [Thermoanaerobaculia bacterium]